LIGFCLETADILKIALPVDWAAAVEDQLVARARKGDDSFDPDMLRRMDRLSPALATFASRYSASSIDRSTDPICDLT
jgi:hypothetical protein